MFQKLTLYRIASGLPGTAEQLGKYLMLTESMQLKKVAILDVVFEKRQTGDDLFDSDFAIACGELQGLIADLIEALGGECKGAA